ncbi:hypothetical protein AVEN_164533-1 [Araneus ventricosus]|uniref:Uncharacterized protein n=1 Tax=Araneus ventricosus TaxID=182803 RepID=A0A4Y2B1Z5_ARAVE|nr:hypothetical protein AVEN_164533-1 [Araneus ventricosus]
MNKTGLGMSETMKLDIHHRSNSFGGLSRRPVTFSVSKIWWAIDRSDSANTSPMGNPISYVPAPPPPPPPISKRASQPDFPRMIPTHTIPFPFCSFRFCERYSAP